MYKKKFTHFIYDAVFVDPEPAKTAVSSTENKGSINPFADCNGLIIKQINILVFDPFGFSLTDTTRRKKLSAPERWGNGTHVRTRKWVINNKLLFRQYDTVNALAISETERLLRAAPYVNDAKINVVPQGTDSVIIFVMVHDKWAITIPAEITDVSANARFRNHNFLGLGQQFEQYARFKRPDEWAFNGFYTISNIDNTYISSTLGYNTDLASGAVYLSFDRPFFSPLARWAGGLYISKNWSQYVYTDTISGEEKYSPADNFYYDVWLGKNLKLSRDISLFNLSTNLTTAVRYYNSTFQRRPDKEINPQFSYRNNQGALVSAALAIQQYYKDKFIYRFGSNEDVPEGLILQLTYGVKQVEETRLRHYAGFEIARAKHFAFGYLSATFAQGLFFNKKVSNDITNRFNLYYFSELEKAGNWNFRQFVNYNFVFGENKLLNERIALTGDEMYGFNSGTLNGTAKMVLNLEAIAYAPYKLIGFKFAPALLAGYGIVGDNAHPLLKSRLFQGYSIALQVRNENLLNSTFMVSVGVYPFLPDDNRPVFRYNPVTSFTLRVRSFAVGKPDFIAF